MVVPSPTNFSCNGSTPPMQSSRGDLSADRQPFSSSATQNISRLSPLSSQLDILLPQEYTGDESGRTFVNTIYEAHRSSVGMQQGTMERCIIEETPPQASSSPLPSATMGIVGGRDRDSFVAVGYRMSTAENYMFPNPPRSNSEHAGHVADHAMSDAQRLHTDNFIFDNARNRASFTNIQPPPNLVPPTHLSVPVPAFSNTHSVERGLVQSGGGETSNSTETNAEMYSLSGSGSWRCNGCLYETKRERDIIRHCLSLHHGGRRMFVCPSCGRRYSRRDSLMRHSRNKGCEL